MGPCHKVPLLRALRGVRPCMAAISRGVPVQFKDLHDALPQGLPLGNFLHRDRLTPCGLAAVKVVDGLLESFFGDFSHLIPLDLS